MELMTRIDIPASEWKMKAGAKVLLLGSCFADEIGEKMVRGGFEAMVNPFGTLYNPASIAASLLRSVSEKEVEIPPLHENRPVNTPLPTWGTSVDRRGARRQTDVGHVDFGAVKTSRARIFKSPWSSSGRGVFVGSVDFNPNPNPNLDPNLDLNCKSSTLKRPQGFLSSQGGFVVDRFYEDKVLDFAMEFVVHKDHTVEFLGYSVFQTGESGAYGYNYVESQEELLRRIDVDAALLHRLIAYHKEHLAQTAYHGPVGIDMLKTADGSIHPCLEINLRLNMGILALLLFEQYGSGATVALTPVREHGFQALVEDGRLMILSEK